AYGIMLTDRVSAGVAANYIQETIYNTSLTTFGLNFGVQYQTTIEGLSIGASVSNFGPRASYDGRDIHFNYDSDPEVHGNHTGLPAELSMGSFCLPTIFRIGNSYYLILFTYNQLVSFSTAL